MQVSAEHRAKLGHVPSSREVRRAALAYMGAADMGRAEFAQAINYSPIAVRKFLSGTYCGAIAANDLLIRAAAWDYMQENPIREEARRAGRLFQTENYRRIRRYFLAAVEDGEVCLLYGPPGTQKTFVLEELSHERRKQAEAHYVYASDRMRPRALLKRIARACRAVPTQQSNDQLINSLVRFFRGKSGAVIVDEAQHLDVHALELLRELHDRAGCGLVLAGSHNLYENFLRSRSQLEQWLSRIDHKDPLPGLLESEVAEIAARELGHKLSEKRLRALVSACQVDDVFAREAGKPARRKYLSVRRLVKVLAQYKREEATPEAA